MCVGDVFEEMQSRHRELCFGVVNGLDKVVPFANREANTEKTARGKDMVDKGTRKRNVDVEVGD